MATGTLNNVELVAVGSWNAAVGSGKVTEDDLNDAVEAYNDQVIDRPVLKIGHQDDNVFNASVNDGAGDGEPAYGWIENVSRGDGSPERPKATSLYGDIVGMPVKLAEIAGSAFRRRSVELLRGVKTTSGKSYRMVLQGLALLGIARPAVKGLADVMELYSDDVTATDLVVLELFDGMTADQVSAFASVLGSLTSVHDTDVVPPRSDDRPDSGDDVQQGDKPADKEIKMPGLTKEQVLAALDAEGDKSIEDRLAELTTVEETAEEKAAREKAEADQAAADQAKAEKDAADKAAADAAAAAAGGDDEKPGTVTLSAAQFAALSDGATKGTEVAKILDAQRRDQLADGAFRDGKITKAELPEWRKALDRDEAGTTSLLSTLTPRFSTQEIGDDAAPTELSEQDAKVVDSTLDNWFGALPTS